MWKNKLVLSDNYSEKIVLINLSGTEFTRTRIGKDYTKGVEYFADRKIFLISNMDFSSSYIEISITEERNYNFHMNNYKYTLSLENNGFTIIFE